MWDSLSTINGLEDSKDNIYILIKSLLFQIASGISEDIAKHINKKLSKNHGIISFSLSSIKFWFYLIAAGLCYLFYSFIDNITLDDLKYIFQELSSIISKDKIDISDYIDLIANIVKNIAPLLIIISIAIVIIGLRKTSIAFSHWNNQTARETEINDIFEAYRYIYKRLLSFSNPRLIIVEDLDRVVDKAIVIGFLKEIYRFNNLTLNSQRKKPVFIIAIKPESQLVINKNPSGNIIDDNNIYAKLFDFTVVLKPIHYQDYSDILLAIIGQESSESRELLNNILSDKDKILDNILPESFNWLITGYNLTIRQLKDRLNHAINLLASLINKEYSNQSNINFSSCAAVTYLELRYAEEYYLIIKEESSFAELIRQSYQIRNIVDENEKKEALYGAIDNFIAGKINSIDEDELQCLKSNLNKMLIDGDIDDDFRMYFYSYPKGSYIKTSDEKDISNLLLLPYDFPSDKNLNEKITRIIENKKDKTISDILMQISNSNRNNFPKIIIENEFLFSTAYKYNAAKTLNTVQQDALWDLEKMKQSKDIVSKIFTYKIDDSTIFWDDYKKKLLDLFSLFEEEHIIIVRIELINIFGEYIINFTELFKSIDVLNDEYYYPIITEHELSLISDYRIAIQLINYKEISNNNIEYIIDFINKYKLDDESYNIGREIIQCAISNVSNKTILSSLIISFLANNKKIDDSLFEFAINNYLNNEDLFKSQICKYINSLSIDSLTELYLSLVDQLIIEKELNDEVLNKLIEQNYYCTVLASYAHNNRLNEISFEDINLIKSIALACTVLNNYNDQIICKIRKAIIVKCGEDIFEEKYAGYYDLFYGDYPLVTINELDNFINFSFSLSYINGSKVEAENYQFIIDFINSQERTAQECCDIFETLFSGGYISCINDNKIIEKIVNELDYSNINFYEMTLEQKDTVADLLKIPLKLNNPSNAIDFMNKVRSQIESLEKIIINHYEVELYIDLINRLNDPTDYTMEWIEETEITFQLPDKVTSKLIKNNVYDKYLIGKILRDGSFNFPMEEVDSKFIVELYFPDSPIFQFLASNFNFVSYLIETKEYIKWDFLEYLRPLYKGKQTLDFVKYLFILISNKEKKYYLSVMGEIKNVEDSKNIAYFLVEEGNIDLLEDDALFSKVYERLWEDVPKEMRGYKGYFSRRRNEWLSKSN
ncbi:MAG: hypothetical protein FWE14_09450 [Lachnospiraceae bacterium]|nr:hypothetical protein [Lachnospiraceae bacterium]